MGIQERAMLEYRRTMKKARGMAAVLGLCMAVLRAFYRSGVLRLVRDRYTLGRNVLMVDDQGNGRFIVYLA